MALSLNCYVPRVWFAVLAAIAALLLSSPGALAGSPANWTITEMSGRVNIVRSGAAPVALTTGDELRPGDMIETAADSSAVLVRNGESIVVAPNSRMGLPSTNDSRFATLILQQFGTLLLKVEKQQQQHFEVKTPYLAAVVKGTTFTVNVDTAGASVHVIEGAVQVGNTTGMSALVRPGQTAIVSSVPGSDLSIQGDSTRAPAQRSEVTQDQGSAGRGDSKAKPKATDTSSIGISPAASNAAPAAFKIKSTVGPVDIDIATATNGLIRSAQVPGQARGQAQGRAQGQARKATSGNGVPGSNSSAGLGSAAANPGGAPAASSPLGGAAVAGNPGGAPAVGNPHGGPVAAGQGGALPATVSVAAQIAASPGSQGNNGKSKKKE